MPFLNVARINVSAMGVKKNDYPYLFHLIPRSSTKKDYNHLYEQHKFSYSTCLRSTRTANSKDWPFHQKQRRHIGTNIENI